MKLFWTFYFVLLLTVIAIFINSPFAWGSVIIIGFIYFELKTDQISNSIEAQDKIMGNRLIEGMKVLSDLMKNAFDHIKSNKAKIDKTNLKLSEQASKIHRLEQQRNQQTLKKFMPPHNEPISENIIPKIRNNAGRPPKEIKTS